MSIHSEHPFLVPPAERDLVRRLRGHLASTVTLWTAGEGRDRAGLTVSSMLVAAGEPGRVIGLIDPDSDLADALHETGRFVVSVLGPGQRPLADAFGGVDPAPGGGFAQAPFVQTPWGPRPEASAVWAGCTVEDERVAGWSSVLTAVIDGAAVGAGEPLLHLRGRYGHWEAGLR
ncbi:flavin reductase family protein [Nigerium massiliense]|uniref:flavin reductase family protein n=1 Tax=Nigerium massiliense TaxID=1522317 RepID=UPI00058DADF6|nr:flavin reductase family protein [Nigerium massiliense]